MRLLSAILGIGLLPLVTLAETIKVSDVEGLRRAIKVAKPGTTISLAPGNYGNGVWVKELNGTEAKPIIITGADKGNPPLFKGGKEAIHFVDCNYVTLQNVKVVGASGNGINADDGGSFDSPSVGMVFKDITIEDVGPSGNRDGLKLSGLDDFKVIGCSFSGWGGSAIDMVGCHDGVIEGCKLVGKEGFTQSTGIQAKGGCKNVLIRKRTSSRRLVSALSILVAPRGWPFSVLRVWIMKPMASLLSGITLWVARHQWPM